jgi:hypothetical protein
MTHKAKPHIDSSIFMMIVATDKSANQRMIEYGLDIIANEPSYKVRLGLYKEIRELLRIREEIIANLN